MLVLAKSLEQGFRTEPDMNAARDWYQKAAALGNTAAIDWLASHPNEL